MRRHIKNKLGRKAGNIEKGMIVVLLQIEIKRCGRGALGWSGRFRFQTGLEHKS